MGKSNREYLYEECPYVILCEGMDEKQFLIQYIDYLVKKCNLPDKINIYNMGGNEDIRKNLSNIPKIANYNKMKSFLIVRDAEKNEFAAANSLKESILKAFDVEISLKGNFVVNYQNKKIGFVLLPGKDEKGEYIKGTLEDLCVSILKNKDTEFSGKELLENVDKYLVDVKSQRKKDFRTTHKNKLHTYFSSTDSFVGMKIGEAAKAQCFDFSHVNLDFLKNAVIDLLKS